MALAVALRVDMCPVHGAMGRVREAHRPDREGVGRDGSDVRGMM
jgi:hypothetical protein